jgi:hypothetical protein
MLIEKPAAELAIKGPLRRTCLSSGDTLLKTLDLKHQAVRLTTKRWLFIIP